MLLAFFVRTEHIVFYIFFKSEAAVRKLRGLYVEDCQMTYLLVQRALRSFAYIKNASCKESFLISTEKPILDFLILDGDIEGWPMDDYASSVLASRKIPIFIFSASPSSTLLPLLETQPKAIVQKTDGVAILSQAIQSFFYVEESLRPRRFMPTR